MTGIVTAPASSVAVTAQEALLADVCSSSGSSRWIGMTRDCMSAPLRLPMQRTATTVIGEKRIAGAAPVGAVGEDK